MNNKSHPTFLQLSLNFLPSEPSLVVKLLNKIIRIYNQILIIRVITIYCQLTFYSTAIYKNLPGDYKCVDNAEIWKLNAAVEAWLRILSLSRPAFLLTRPLPSKFKQCTYYQKLWLSPLLQKHTFRFTVSQRFDLTDKWRVGLFKWI